MPSDAPLGIDTPLPPPPPIDWAGKGTIVPIHPPPPEKPASAVTYDETEAQEETEANEEGVNVDNPIEEIHDGEDEATTWHDVALSIAAELMFRAREEVRTQLGYSTSAGLARNKFLAKLAASYRKPNGQVSSFKCTLFGLAYFV